MWKLGSRACDSPECLRCTLAAHRPPQLWRLTDLPQRAVAHLDAFISPSRFTADLHAARGFAVEMECLPHFLDPCDEDWQRPGPRPHARPYVLYVGRLVRHKGVDRLIEAARLVPGIDVLIVGDGPDEARLRSLASSEPRVRFLGPRAADALGVLYVHALASIVPSLTHEMFGMVVLEAFARKTPVIASTSGALPEIVGGSGGGILFETVGDLASAIERIQQSPDLRRELGENGYAAFRRNWTTERYLKRYFALLRSLAIRKQGSVPWEASPAALPQACLDAS
jgi:glycosyltransferase involved in cell wall biosynthesis